MIGVTSSGSFDKTIRWMTRVASADMFSNLSSYGERGVRALENATPKDQGDTAKGWAYRIVKGKDRFKIEWFNTHEVDGAVIAILIQYGHGTGTGGWVEGRDYINPAMRPIFDELAREVWKEVKR